ncbi:MAG: ribonuclease P protein component 4 [Candidatus Parvarchaeum sp.]
MAVHIKDEKRFKRDFDYLMREARKNKALSDRYAYIAKRMLTSKKIKLPKEEKFLICRSCNRLLIPGVNCRVRLKQGFLTYKCLNCGNVRKVKYDKRI